MKRLSVFYVFAVLAISTSVVSCKKETVSPSSENGITREVNNGLVAQPISTFPLLTKHGNTSISYYSDGKIKSVNRGDGWTMTYSYPTQFANLILAEEKYNGSQSGTYTYFLDANGRCVKLQGKINQYNVDYEYVFTYQGSKLIEQKATKGFGDKYTFSYDAQNRLQELFYYGSNGQLVNHIFYAYHNASTPATTDKYPINPTDAWMDSYLPVFGKFSKDLLVYKIKYKGVGNGTWMSWSLFSYNFNANGFVTLRKEEPHENGKPFAGTVNVAYEYNTQRGL